MDDDENTVVDINQCPEDILLDIFSYLSIQDVNNVSQTCKQWCRVALDDFLWKDLFIRDWKLKKTVQIAGGKNSWKSEYKRLVYHTPRLLSQELRYHKDQVLHVCFSHNGQLFSTCSKDGTCKVWISQHPCKLLFKYDMKQFHWKYTQFSQFNMSDTLLLVSGVHFGDNSTSGEIAVFSILNNFELQCRMINKPYDIFGTWYNDTHLLSGSLYWIGQLNSCSALRLNKASQAIETENESVVMRLFKFQNQNASSIRTVMIANCYNDKQKFLLRRRKQCFKHINSCTSCYTKYLDFLPNFEDLDNDLNDGSDSDKFVVYDPFPIQSEFDTEQGQPPTFYNSKVSDRSSAHSGSAERTESDRNSVHSSSAERTDFGGECAKDICDSAEGSSIQMQESQDSESCSSNNQVSSMSLCDNFNLSDTALSDSEEFLCDKILIFTLGSETYTPHQIGLKRVQSLELGNPAGTQEAQRNILPNVSNNMQGLDKTYDKVDHIIEMAGHIIGMSLSPDHRFLYVNCRPWPVNYRIEDPLVPPPLAQEIDIHVIDLYTMEEVGTKFKSHKAYTANDECFFIFLNVNEEYVASGAEDKHGYIWDRHYGICLDKFQHNDVVNSVAFNPFDPEMLVTASDDHNIKVWRSRNWFRQHPQQEQPQSNKT